MERRKKQNTPALGVRFYTAVNEDKGHSLLCIFDADDTYKYVFFNLLSHSGTNNLLSHSGTNIVIGHKNQASPASLGKSDTYSFKSNGFATLDHFDSCEYDPTRTHLFLSKEQRIQLSELVVSQMIVGKSTEYDHLKERIMNIINIFDKAQHLKIEPPPRKPTARLYG